MKIYEAIQGMLEIVPCKQSAIAGMLRQPVVDVQIALYAMKNKGLVEKRDELPDALWAIVRKSKSGKLTLDMKELEAAAEPVGETKLQETIRLDPNGKIAKDHAALRARLMKNREVYWKKTQETKGKGRKLG